jgi:hypothetical protein
VTDADRFLASRLVPSETVAVLEEHWPLLELRKKILGDEGEAPIPIPARLPSPQWWAVARQPAGIGKLPLEPREAELFLLLARHPIGEALARLEEACPEVDRAELPAKTQAWLARSVELGFWAGLG